MDLAFYKSLAEQVAIMRHYGYEEENPESAKSKRARSILDLIMEDDKYRQTELDMGLIFCGKLHRRKYRKKYDWIMWKARAKHDAARLLLDAMGITETWDELAAVSLRAMINLARECA